MLGPLVVKIWALNEPVSVDDGENDGDVYNDKEVLIRL